MALPIFKTDNKDLMLLETAWSAQLNPLLKAPMGSGIMLKNIALTTGANIINHKLGRSLQGWMLVRQRAAAAVYDTQDANQMPQLTLTLTASAPVIVDIYVF